MNPLKIPIQTETWIRASWNEYIQAIDELYETHAKSYYYNENYRIEMTSVSFDHSSDHTMVTVAISLYAIIKKIALTGLDNCSFRKTGIKRSST